MPCGRPFWALSSILRVTDGSWCRTRRGHGGQDSENQQPVAGADVGMPGHEPDVTHPGLVDHSQELLQLGGRLVSRSRW